MIRETALARADERHWDDQWNRHFATCLACSAALKAKSVASQGCPMGAAIWKDRKEANDALAESIRLDREPLPGKGELF